MLRRLRVSEEQFRSTIDNAPVGMAIIAPTGRFLRVNKAMCEILGYESDELVTLTFQDLTHPDDLAADLSLLAQLVAGAIPRYRLAKRYLRKGGSLVDVMLYVSLVRDAHGAPQHFIAQVEDVTRMTQAERTLREQTALLSLMKAVAVAANEASTSRAAMQQCLDLICRAVGHSVGHVYLVEDDRLVPTDLWHLDDEARFSRFVRITNETVLSAGVGPLGRVLASARPLWIEDVSSDPEFVRSRGGELPVLSGFAVPVMLKSEVCAVLEFYTGQRTKENPGLLEVMAHVGTQLGRVVERERHAEAVRALSLIDDLTLLHNRRGFLTLAELQLKAAARARDAVLLFFVDMDGLKQINDQLGHETGDQAIIDLGSALKATFRESDILARIGGDEFVALALASEVSVEAIVERLQRAIASFNPRNGRAYRLCASIGVAASDPSRPSSIEELLKRADGLMYEQKRRRKAEAVSPLGAR